MPSKDIELEVYKAEYDRLKAEQTQRIQFRDNLLMAHLTVVGALIGFIVANDKNPFIHYAYLIIPWTSSIIGWAYLNNDILISNIRDYLRDDLSARLKSCFEVRQPFKWEHDVGNTTLWRVRKSVQSMMDAATFSVPSFGALVRLAVAGFLSPQHPSPLFYALYGFDAIIAALLITGMLVWNFKEVRLGNGPSQNDQTPTNE